MIAGAMAHGGLCTSVVDYDASARGQQTAGVKLGPALPHSLILDGVEAGVDHPLPRPSRLRSGWAPVLVPDYPLRSACRMRGWQHPGHRRWRYATSVVISTNLPAPSSGAGTIAEVGAQLRAGLLDSHVACLTSDQLCTTPFATAFEVREPVALPPHGAAQVGSPARIGVLEI